MVKAGHDEAKKRITKLREAINHYRYLYHVENISEISDEALDSLKYELAKLESFRGRTSFKGVSVL